VSVPKACGLASYAFGVAGPSPNDAILELREDSKESSRREKPKAHLKMN